VDAFYAMTLGNARALGLEAEIGTLAVAAHADLVVLEPAATPALAHRLEALDASTTTGLDERLFALMTMGDDRAVAATYVAGQAGACARRLTSRLDPGAATAPNNGGV
jgi:guanine deaminase